MSILWHKLPPCFLKKKFAAWNRLDYGVRKLIVELAEAQNVKCFHCACDRGLVIEHDHDPEIGPGKPYTVFNIRGLTCGACNWHLMIYEKDLKGEYRAFEHVDSYITSREWENYIYAYDRRVVSFHEAQLETQMGEEKYWRRRNVIDKFDAWIDMGAGKSHYPWRWQFDDVKEKRRFVIRTPKQFFATLQNILAYLKSELAKDPAWMPPEEMKPGLLRLKNMLDDLYPMVELRYLEIQRERDGAVALI